MPNDPLIAVVIKHKWPPWGRWALLSLILAGAASAQIFYSDIWYDLFHRSMWLIDLVEDLLLPLWVVTTTMAFVQFPAQRKRLWWLLLPAPLCLLRLIEFLFTMLAWSIGGFV
jgi:hypothetical protein